MFRVEMLPAAHGDALWVEWSAGGQTRRLLIDGGPAHTYPHLRERILHLPREQRVFELLVVTHVDADHIEGVVRLLQDAEALDVRFERIWFNGSAQLDEVDKNLTDELGALQGEYLSFLIADYEERTGTEVLNRDFPRGYVGWRLEDEVLPAVLLPGELRLTLLSPDTERLLDMRDRWEDELGKAEIESGDEDTLRQKLADTKQLRALGDELGDDEEVGGAYEFPDPEGLDCTEEPDDVLGGGEMAFGCDASPANGSSIALLAEHEGVSALLSGDAYAGVLLKAITKLLAERNKSKLKLDLFKLPHHGSMANLTDELLARLSCKHYLISTSGAKFRHPHEKSLQLLLVEHGRGKPRFHFNYRTETTEPWVVAESGAFVSFYPTGVSLLL